MTKEANVLRVRSEFINDYLSGSRCYTKLCPLCRPEIPICDGRPVLHTDYCLNFAEEEYDGVPQVWLPRTALDEEDYVVAPQCMYMEEGVYVEYLEYYWLLDTSYQPFHKYSNDMSKKVYGYSSDEDDDDDDECGVLY